MQVRLTGITEEPAYINMPGGGPAIETPSRRITMARCEVVNQPTPTSYSVILVPYALVEGAQVGDEFTLHLERVKK
jgi:hypothetical protein